MGYFQNPLDEDGPGAERKFVRLSPFTTGKRAMERYMDEEGFKDVTYERLSRVVFVRIEENGNVRVVGGCERENAY